MLHECQKRVGPRLDGVLSSCYRTWTGFAIRGLAEVADLRLTVCTQQGHLCSAISLTGS